MPAHVHRLVRCAWPQLSKTVAAKTLPRLPKRGLFTTNTRSTKFVDKRRHSLERYLQDVLCHPQCENSVGLLSWLGGVSTMRNDAEESKRASPARLARSRVRHADPLTARVLP